MVYHRSAFRSQFFKIFKFGAILPIYIYSSNTCEAPAARRNKHPLPAQAQSPYLKFWPPFCELWLWFSFNSETFLENGSKKRRRQSGRWFSWAWRAWLDSIAVPVFAVWLNLTNTETAATTPLNLLQNLWSASAQWKVLESTIFGRPVDLVLQTLGRNREQVTSFKSHYLCLFLEQFIWRGCGSLGDGKTSQCSWMYPSV